MKRRKMSNRFLACMLAMVLCITSIGSNAFLMQVHAENMESVSENDITDVNLQQKPVLEESNSVTEETNEENVTEELVDETVVSNVSVPQEEVVISVGENDDDAVYSACMVTEEQARLAAVEGIWPEGVADVAWISAGSLEGIFEQTASKWVDGTVSENGIEVPYTGYLFITLNKSANEESVIIPEMINGKKLNSVVIWSYEQCLSVKGLTINNSNITFRGGTIEGNLPLNFTENSYEVRLEDVNINGSIYACDENQDEVSEPEGELTFGNNVTIGGIYSVDKVKFNSDVRVAHVADADRVEFYQVETNNHNVTLVFEGYNSEKLPQFNQGVSRDDENWQKACEYRMAVENTDKYPVKWYQNTLYLKKDNNYYRVWEYDRAVCLEEGNEPISVDEIDWEKSSESNEVKLVNSLAEEFNNPDDEKYLADGIELRLFRFFDKEGNEKCYLEKEEKLYQITTEDEELQNSNLATIESEGLETSAVVLAYYDSEGWGGLAECPNITVRYLTEESFDGEWQDEALAYETSVINYILPGVLQEVEDFSYWQERWDKDYNADDAYVDVDGCVYDRSNAVAEVERFVAGSTMNEETGEEVVLNSAEDSFMQCGRGDYCSEYINGEFASIQNAILAMRSDATTQGGEGYYRLRLRGNAENVSMLLNSPFLKGIAVEADWTGEGENAQPPRIVLNSIKWKKADTIVKLVNIYAGNAEENQLEPASFSIRGEGNKVIFVDCKINQLVESSADIDLIGNSTAKSLVMTEGATLNYAEGGSVLGIEDFMDTSEAVIAGHIRLVARKDAKVILGDMNSLTGRTISENCLEGNSIEFYAETDNGKSTDIVLTKDFEVGYQVNINNPDDIYENSFDIKMLDANDDNCVFSNSMYGIDSCFYIETEDYQNENFDDYYNHVLYDADTVQKIVTIDKALYDKTVDKQALLRKIQAEYKEIIDDNYYEIWFNNIGGQEDRIAVEDNPFYGKTVFTEVGNEIRYAMYAWRWTETDTWEDDVLFDNNKYVMVLKETDLSKAKIATVSEQIYTAKAITPSVTVTLNGTELVKDTDYVVAYTNNINPGTATITINGINNYSGENSINFTIKKKTETAPSVNPPKEPEKPHTHTKGDWVVEKEATGSETGSKVQKCTQCGAILARETIPKYKVTLNAKKIPLQAGKSTTAIKATVMDGDKVVSWKSSNKKIATVSKKGKITGKKAGKATITVTTKKGAKASVQVVVQKKKVKTTKVKVDKKKLTLKPKKSYTLKVTITPVSSLEKVNFKSSNKKVATVSSKGKITAKRVGKATITITSGKKKATVKVTVKK